MRSAASFVKAVDTNILVRLIARDDAVQLSIAESIIDRGAVMILPTVLMECEWVLRSSYKLSRRHIATEMSNICGLESVHVVSATSVADVLGRYAEEGDFADLLHLALATEENAEAFVTFDQRLASSDKLPVQVV